MLIKSPCPERVHKKVVRFSFFFTADFYDLPKSEFGKKKRGSGKTTPQFRSPNFQLGEKENPKTATENGGGGRRRNEDVISEC